MISLTLYFCRHLWSSVAVSLQRNYFTINKACWALLHLMFNDWWSSGYLYICLHVWKCFYIISTSSQLTYYRPYQERIKNILVFNVNVVGECMPFSFLFSFYPFNPPKNYFLWNIFKLMRTGRARQEN